jgi:hypothetical protein
MKRRCRCDLGRELIVFHHGDGKTKKRVRQAGSLTPFAALPMIASHPFYERLNQILDEKRFDEYVEGICKDFYAG